MTDSCIQRLNLCFELTAAFSSTPICHLLKFVELLGIDYCAYFTQNGILQISCNFTSQQDERIKQDIASRHTGLCPTAGHSPYGDASHIIEHPDLEGLAKFFLLQTLMQAVQVKQSCPAEKSYADTWRAEVYLK